MDKKEFEILRHIVESKETLTQRVISEETGHSLGIVNTIVTQLKKQDLIDADYHVTKKGLEALEPYRVKNAIFLAAGMSTRFVPFSYEKPKGLTVVKGEVLIERQIRQIREAGVEEIILVLGHMMEKFLYLVEKYGVKVVVNNDYRYKNTHSSVFYARDYLKNSYICCADNYFPKNLFHKYEYHSLYSVLYMPGVMRGERGVFTDKTGLIIKTQRPSVDQWVMNGYAYFDVDFSNKFKGILEEMWGAPGSDNLYWEQVYAEHVPELPLYAVQYNDNEVMEFDSVSELEEFDPEYIKYNDLTMTKNVCTALNCSVSDIHGIRPIQKGYTNKSFSFDCCGKKYVYRNPGQISAQWLDRKSEKCALEIAKKLGIDNSYIYEDEEGGWKISKYIEVTEQFDFSNPKHLIKLCDALRKLYSKQYSCGRLKDFLFDAKQLLSSIRQIDEESYKAATEKLPLIEQIDREIKADGWPVQLSHNDLYEDNLLLSNDDLYVIDWEYAGDTDIGYDLSKLIVKNNAYGKDIDKWLRCFYDRDPDQEEKRHIIGCAAVSFYYWYVWAVYMVKKGNNYSDLVFKYLTITNDYQEEYFKIINK